MLKTPIYRKSFICVHICEHSALRSLELNMDVGYLVWAVVNGVIMGGIYALMGTGLTLMWGVMDIINFAQGDIVMIGMYTSFFVATLLGIDPLIAMFASASVTFTLGVVVQKIVIDPVLRSERVYQILVTLGLMLVLENMALVLWGPWSHTMPLKLGSMSWLSQTINFGLIRITISRLISLPLSFALTIMLHLFLTRTKAGLSIRAVADDTYLANLMGINIKKTYLLVTSLGFGLCGFAGGLLMLYYFVSPSVGITFTLITLLCVCMGGRNNYIRVFIASIIIGITESVSAFLLPIPIFKQIVYLSLFILVLILFSSRIGFREAKK